MSKLVTNESFVAKLADGLMKDGVLDSSKAVNMIPTLHKDWLKTIEYSTTSNRRKI